MTVTNAFGMSRVYEQQPSLQYTPCTFHIAGYGVFFYYIQTISWTLVHKQIVTSCIRFSLAAQHRTPGGPMWGLIAR